MIGRLCGVPGIAPDVVDVRTAFQVADPSSGSGMIYCSITGSTRCDARLLE